MCGISFMRKDINEVRKVLTEMKNVCTSSGTSPPPSPQAANCSIGKYTCMHCIGGGGVLEVRGPNIV